jgi:hypothetical protein
MHEQLSLVTKPSERRFPSNAREVAVMDEAVDRICLSTIGFMKLRREGNVERGLAVGSGTLVSVDDVLGVLTAAHVLAELPDDGPVGLVRFKEGAKNLQRLHVDMRFAKKAAIVADGKIGPSDSDIGFLRLPLDVVGSLKATGVFHNLTKRSVEAVIEAVVQRPYVDAIIGVVAELTTYEEVNRIVVGASMWLGNVVDQRDARGFDLLDFRIASDGSVKPPRSYGGVSGGGLWRISLSDDFAACRSITPVGVLFYQSEPAADGERLLSCQGPHSVYVRVVEAARKLGASASLGRP